MNPFEMVAIIVVAVMIASVLRARFQPPRGGGVSSDRGEARALREEVARLRERLEVLERITVEKENSLAREIENLRER